MHICTDFVVLGLGSNHWINSKIDEVLTGTRGIDCQLAPCPWDQSDPLLDTDVVSIDSKFAYRGNLLFPLTLVLGIKY